jgi:hypothetical protein
MSGGNIPGDGYVPLVRSDVEWVELDGEVVVHDPRARTLHRLNATATAVWTACDGAASVVEIVRAVQEYYAGPRDGIARDVRSIIQRFRRLGLVRVAPARRGG